MSILKFKITLALLVFILGIHSCKNDNTKEEQKELLIYCGITMIQPMTEIKTIIEEQENCKIQITKDGSGNLLKAIEMIGVGDLYLPGSEAYISSAFSKNLISDTAYVGQNRLVMMVQKGNPLKINSNLENLLNKEFYIIIGNPNTGSIGKATKKALQQKGILKEVEQNAIKYTTDSKDLTLALINKEADLVINWYATYTWNNHSEYIDIIEIDEKYSQKRKLILAILKSSKHPDIAKNILELAHSERGQEIFKKYGLY
ncbi:MAG: solute-binding protein [Bacteroidales bacterium]|nr:solute-binding protein [Bacteroidales bacterium]